ncbi:MAG TPA: cell division protein FtsQ, partial [Novosphingobium sp.]|nr:cell division protein FtsQ [Novosphingobium sp.]
MNRKITRKPTSARRAAQRQGAARKVEAARLRTGSVLDRAMALVPLGEEGLHKLFLGAILVGAVGLMGLVAVLAGVPAMAEQHVAQIATHAGFEVRHVEVRGTHHLNELRVYERALAQRNRAMTEVDLAAL